MDRSPKRGKSADPQLRKALPEAAATSLAKLLRGLGAARVEVSKPAPAAPRRPVGFNFTSHIRALCVDIAERVDEFSHVDMRRVAVRYCQTRKAVQHGIQASLTPLRFEGGSMITRRRGRDWTIQRLYAPDGTEFLYLLSFYLPRFLNQTYEEKLATVFHELWHIGPAFDGDLRRYPGRCYAHGHDQGEYHAAMHPMVNRYLESRADSTLHAFLQHDSRQLFALHGGVHGIKIATPRLLPIPKSDPA